MQSFCVFAKNSRGALGGGLCDFCRCLLDIIFVEVYKWIVLALSISSDFWLRWLVHEA
jgi:hypothetical protein